jgi:hypothetical protein
MAQVELIFYSFYMLFCHGVLSLYVVIYFNYNLFFLVFDVIIWLKSLMCAIDVNLLDWNVSTVKENTETR